MVNNHAQYKYEELNMIFFVTYSIKYCPCVIFSSFGDHYEWNKVTSCIHNILSGQRWIEHYGEMSIKNINSDACQCKVTFVKVREQK